MNTTEFKLLRKISNHLNPNTFIAFRSEDGRLYKITGFSEKHFTTPGLHIIPIEKAKMESFDVVTESQALCMGTTLVQ